MSLEDGISRKDRLVEPAAVSIFLTLNMTHVKVKKNEPAAHSINLSHLRGTVIGTKSRVELDRALAVIIIIVNFFA